MKKTITTTLAAIVAVLITTTAVQAIGTLTPQGTAGADTQYTTNNIFNKLTDFTSSADVGTGLIELPGDFIATFNTLSEIYALLVAEEDDLVPGKILAGTTVFGVEGTVIEGTPELEWSTAQPNANWAAARNACTALVENSPTVVGADNWRLPTIDELLQGIAYDWVTENDGTGERLVSGTNYWSSTAYDGSIAWVASWNGSVLNFGDDKAVSYSVLCVRQYFGDTLNL